MLDSLTEADEELAAEVRRLLFVFEDIVKLDDRSIQLILREADQKDLALALRGVSDDVKERILGNMSERGAQMLLEEMEFQPPQRKRVIEEAQGRIVAIVRKLEEAGAVVLSRGEEDAVVWTSSRGGLRASVSSTPRRAAARRDVADVLAAASAEAEQIRRRRAPAGEAEGRADGLGRRPHRGRARAHRAGRRRSSATSSRRRDARRARAGRGRDRAAPGRADPRRRDLRSARARRSTSRGTRCAIWPSVAA